MMAAVRRLGRTGLALVIVVALTSALGALMLGPGNALRLAVAGVSNAALDPFTEHVCDNGLPVLDVFVDPAQLASLQADLPFSGGRYVPAEVRAMGMTFPAGFRYRGLVLTTHYLGEKRSFRLKLGKRNPFAPYRKLDILNPKTPDLLHDRIATLLAARLGVDAPALAFVNVRLNDRPHGLMEAMERIDGRFERLRGRAKKQVPVFKGDSPALSGRALPQGRPLWADAAHWQYESDADSAAAREHLRAVVAWINGPDSSRQELDSLARVLDTEAFARYSALVQLLGTWHIDNYHNQWLVAGADARFRPVLWDAHPGYDRGLMPIHSAHDALIVRLMDHGDWRLQRDRLLYRAWHELHEQGAFDRLYSAQVALIRPAVLMDRNRATMLTDDAMHVHRTSAIQWARATDRFRDELHAVWERLRPGFRINELHVGRTDSTLHIHSSGEPALRVEHTEGAATLSITGSGNYYLDTLPSVVIVHPVIRAADKAREDIYAMWNYRVAEPVDLTLHIARGVPAALRFFNAVTDEEITPN